jgi:hypothetical protein
MRINFYDLLSSALDLQQRASEAVGCGDPNGWAEAARLES